MAHIIGAKTFVVKAMHGKAAVMLAWAVERVVGEKVKGWLDKPETMPHVIAFPYVGEVNPQNGNIRDTSGSIVLNYENLMCIQVEEVQTAPLPPEIIGMPR